MVRKITTVSTNIGKKGGKHEHEIFCKSNRSDGYLPF